MLEGDAKWGAFYGCEAFVLPSHQENFGISVVEALACDKPVLISSKVNIWREISEDNAGIVEEDTLEGVRRLLRLYLKNFTNKTTRSSYNCFKKYFRINLVTQNMFSVIKESQSWR
jgi:glycosyltransferase involved in cell wall biosynthesis